MTEQEELQYLFDKSYNHIMAQGKPSHHDGECQYHSDDGLQCAAAPFILEYYEGMEERGFNGKGSVAERFPKCIDPIALKHSDFVGLLQDCHDNAVTDRRCETDSDFIPLFCERMFKLADEYDLSYSR